MGKVIGIDLGTTNSVCAVVEGGEPKVINNAEGGRVTPSVVGFAKDGTRFVGDIAKRQLLINPAATIHSIKRFIGKTIDEVKAQIHLVHYRLVPGNKDMAMVMVEDQEFSPQEIAALILEKMKFSAQDYLGEEVTEAVVTVPAYFTDNQRKATRDACVIAGLDVLRIINEPTAAALAYVHERSEPSCIAVFDWGGGTFDISLLRVDKDIAEVLSTRGNNVLGGGDIDQVIVDWLVGQFKAESGVDVSEDPIVMQRLSDAAERAKVELSATTSTTIHLPFLISDEDGPKHLQSNLLRETLEGLAAHLFKQTIDECKQALTDADLQASAIDEVILVGGSSRIPMVQQQLTELFGPKLNKTFNPDEVVAIGAAIQASMLGGSTKAVTLLDVTNFSLGIEVEGGQMATLIPKNMTIPTQATRMVSTVTDDQRVVKIHILQGEDAQAVQNTSLGEFELHNIQPGARGVPRIDVCFSIDANGIVLVTAEDRRTGVSDEIVISAGVALTQAEIEEMKDHLYVPSTAGDTDAPEAAEDNGQTDLLREDIDLALAHVEAQLLLKKIDMPEDEAAAVEALIDETRTVLASDDASKMSASLAALKEIQAELEAR